MERRRSNTTNGLVVWFVFLVCVFQGVVVDLRRRQGMRTAVGLVDGNGDEERRVAARFSDFLVPHTALLRSCE